MLDDWFSNAYMDCDLACLLIFVSAAISMSSVCAACTLVLCGFGSDSKSCAFFLLIQTSMRKADSRLLSRALVAICGKNALAECVQDRLTQQETCKCFKKKKTPAKLQVIIITIGS